LRSETAKNLKGGMLVEASNYGSLCEK